MPSPKEQQDDVAHSVRHLMEFALPTVSRTPPKLAVPVIRRCANCGPRAPGAAADALRIQPAPLGNTLIGSEKTGDDRWYEKFVPIADRLLERHLLEIKKEGSI